jgi:RND family efflux transporter MFP subunit
MSQRQRIVKIILPVLIILLGIAVMMILIKTRPAPKKETRKDTGTLVRVLPVQNKVIDLAIKGTGTVDAAQEVSLIPQVSGRVTYISPNLVVGGFFKKDEIIFAIEDTDYRFALEKENSAKIRAEYELETMESQAQIARDEWERLNSDSGTPPNPLVLYEPQLRSARAALASAAASVEQAQTDLERTKVKAPFHARVRAEDVDIGQYVKSGSSIAVIAGTDIAEIIVPLAMDDLPWLDIPRPGEVRKGSAALVRASFGGEEQEWRGHIVRSTGEVDVRTRMMQVIIEVSDPYGLKEKNRDRPDLATGMFVEVLMQGKTLSSVFVIPRTAFRDNSTVWIMDNDNMLRIQEVVPLKMEKEQVIISEGLENGNLLVLTNVSGAADGMKLRQTK